MSENKHTENLLSQPITKIRVLIVEDDKNDRILLKEGILNVWPDSEIDEVSSMWETYETLKKSSYSIVLLDLNLEDTLGPSSVEEIRRLDRNSSVVVFTNLITDEIISRCLKAGANHVAPKYYIHGEMFKEILEEHIKL